MKKKTNKCVKYKKCKFVPCDQAMPGCAPSYCTPGSSRNWTLCNMAEFGGKYSKLKRYCRDTSKCITSKRTKKIKNSVLASELHKKMPYIWRFLKPNTRKLMIKIAKQPIPKINIPFHVWPDRTINLNKMTKKNRSLYNQLRKTYKNI